MIDLKLAMVGLTELAGKQQLLVLSNGSYHSQQASLENRMPLVDLISSTSSETDVVVSFEGNNKVEHNIFHWHKCQITT